MDPPTCDPGLVEAVKSLIYAAPRTDIKELHNVRQLLVDKYGKEFALQAMEPDEFVSEKVLRKLTVQPPPVELVNGYLEEIARTYGVDWPKRPIDLDVADDDDEDDDDNPSGGQKIKIPEEPIAAEGIKTEELSRATPPRDIGPGSPLRVNPPNPRTDNLRPVVKGAGLDLKPSKKMETAAKKGTESKGYVLTIILKTEGTP